MAESDPAQLGSIAFFDDLTAHDIKLLAPLAQQLNYQEDQVIFHAHEHASVFHVLVTGSVALKVHVPHLGPIPVQTLKSGDALGWSWLVPPYHWHFDARAIEPVTAIAFDARALRHLMDDHSDMGYRLLRRITSVMAQRLQSTRLQLLDVYETRT